MEQSNRTPIFTDAALTSIADSLPEPLNDRRRELLPRVLQEWFRIDLREHLSREPRTAMQARISSIEKLKAPARNLIKALARIDQRDHIAIIMQMIEVEGGRWLDGIGASELEKRQAQMRELRDFLAKLASMESRKFFNLKRGQPRNRESYLVLLDAAAIFEWYTGCRAARGVDRIWSNESGPFFRCFGPVALDLRKGHRRIASGNEELGGNAEGPCRAFCPDRQYRFSTSDMGDIRALRAEYPPVCEKISLVVM